MFHAVSSSLRSNASASLPRPGFRSDWDCWKKRKCGKTSCGDLDDLPIFHYTYYWYYIQRFPGDLYFTNVESKVYPLWKMWRTILLRQKIWATVNIWYIVPSHQFLKGVLSFFRSWYISKCYCFLKSVLSFSKPQLNFPPKKTRILLSIKINFGCSSYTLLWKWTNLIETISAASCNASSPSSAEIMPGSNGCPLFVANKNNIESGAYNILIYLDIYIYIYIYPIIS